MGLAGEKEPKLLIDYFFLFGRARVREGLTALFPPSRALPPYVCVKRGFPDLHGGRDSLASGFSG